MTPADIRRQVVVEELDLSADGRLAVVVRRAVRGNRYVSHLYAIALDGRRVATPRRLTLGTRSRRVPSPRARTAGSVAFVRTDPTDDDAVASLVVLDLRSGRQRSLPARGHGSVAEVAWSPDGRRLAFTAEVDPPRFLVGRVPPVGRGRARKRGAEIVERAIAACPADYPGRLALGRNGPRRPMVAPVRRRHADRCASPPGHLRRLGRIRPVLGAGWTDGRVHRRPGPGRRHAPAAGRLGVDVDGAGRAAPAAGARRLREPRLVLARRSLAGGDRRPRGRPARRRQSGDPRGAGGRVRSALGARPRARSTDRQLDRHGPQRLDGLGPSRAVLAGSGHDRGHGQRSRPLAPGPLPPGSQDRDGDRPARPRRRATSRAPGRTRPAIRWRSPRTARSPCSGRWEPGRWS